MPWKDATVDELRREFVTLAEQQTMPLSQLCRRFGISRKTGWKWRTRYRQEGDAGLADRSRRPQTSPTQTPPDMVERIRIIADANPSWGAGLIRARLLHLGMETVPAASTIAAILHREQLRVPVVPAPRPVIRFEADAPNHRWQMDSKGWVQSRQGRIMPFTVLDESSRYLLMAEHTPTTTFVAIQALLTDCFRRYGLPWQILSDNGSPWGHSWPGVLTRMDVWFLRLGIRPRHGRPGHPQTQGKIERFHKTLALDVFQHHTFDSPHEAQWALDDFRLRYNHERPHSAVNGHPPATAYTLSPRPFPDVLPEVIYDDDAAVRRVSRDGWIQYAGRRIFLAEALQTQPVGVYPTRIDGVIRVQFCARTVRTVDLRILQKADR